MLIGAAAAKPRIALAKEQSQWLGLFVRSLVGLDRRAAVDAFGAYLDNTKFTADQIRFIDLIVNNSPPTAWWNPRALRVPVHRPRRHGPGHRVSGS